MKRAALSGSLLLLVSLAPAPTESAPGGQDWIVVFKDSVPDPAAEARSLSAKHGLSPTHVYRRALKGMAANIPDGQLAAIKKAPGVAYVYPNLQAELDGFTIEPFTTPEFFDAGGRRVTHLLPELPLPEQALPCYLGLGEPCVEELPENTGEGVGIAVFDTGIDSSHPDLMKDG